MPRYDEVIADSLTITKKATGPGLYPPIPRGISAPLFWHCGGCQYAQPGWQGAIAIGLNAIQATPLLLPVGATLDGLAVNVNSVTANAVVRFGLYTCDDPVALLPGSLIVDVGQQDVSAGGIKAITGLNVKLPVGQVPGLYWIASLWGTAAPNPIAATPASPGWWNLLGWGTNLNTNNQMGWAVNSFTFGALPTVFPQSAIPMGQGVVAIVPAMWARVLP